MNIARKLCLMHNTGPRRTSFRKFRFSAVNYEATQTTQPEVQEEKFDFEDIQVLERTERRKAKIEPFMKNVMVSVFNNNMLEYPEILNKEETEDMERRITAIENVFSDTEKTKEDRRNILKLTKMFAAPVSLTQKGLASNCTENLRYLEVISQDFELGQEIIDHWVGLKALKAGLTEEQYNMVVGDLTDGSKTISLCIKEKVSERLNEPDFKTSADLDGQGVWRISGEKVCDLTDGFLLVLAKVEASRLKGFLVHPGVHGVTYRKPYITFYNTPATPLDSVKDADLAHILGLSRLYSATLCRTRVEKAIKAVVDYVKPRIFGGKPLSEVSLIRKCIGEALLDVYASESTEYFTAGLVDGYESPDAEIELAMCRNFMATHGLTSTLNLLSIPSLDQEEQCTQMMDHMRHLASRGETCDNANIFIALSGIHHAGKIMANEIKQIRNPLLHPGFIMKKVFANRFQEKDEPKLTLRLEEYLHPSLRLPAQQLEYCVLRMRYACETLMSRHGKEVSQAYTELVRLAEAGTEILAMTAVLARASRSYCIGIRNADIEMKLSACFVEKSKDKVKRLVKDIDDGEYLNLDNFKVDFGKKMFENKYVVDRPTARVFW